MTLDDIRISAGSMTMHMIALRARGCFMAQIRASVGRDGVNQRADVEIVQALLNQHIADLAPLRPLKVDGKLGARTIAAIEHFQSEIMKLNPCDGRVDPHGRTLTGLRKAVRAHQSAHRGQLTTRQPNKPLADWVGVAASEATWVTIAAAEDGVKEEAGYAKNNPRILEYIATFPQLKILLKDRAAGIYYGDVDETAWCACFVNWCLLKAGRPRGPSPRAQDWLRYGIELDMPLPGAITVIYKKPKTTSDSSLTPSGFHVGFYVRGDSNSVTLVGGNQGNRVQEKIFVGYEVRGYRWPS
jgi:uncharacterized protein (TIGR02594 family)